MSVTIPTDEQETWLNVWEAALGSFDAELPADPAGKRASLAAAQTLFDHFGELASSEDFQRERKKAFALWSDKTALRLELTAVESDRDAAMDALDAIAGMLRRSAGSQTVEGEAFKIADAARARCGTRA